jgi:hypothetical protein
MKSMLIFRIKTEISSYPLDSFYSKDLIIFSISFIEVFNFRKVSGESLRLIIKYLSVSYSIMWPTFPLLELIL